MTTEIVLPDAVATQLASFADFIKDFNSVNGIVRDKRPLPSCATRDIQKVFSEQRQNFPEALEVNTAYCIDDVSVKNGAGCISVHRFDDNKLGQYIADFVFPQELIQLNVHIFLDSFKMHNFRIEVVREGIYSLCGKYGIQIGAEKIVFHNSETEK